MTFATVPLRAPRWRSCLGMFEKPALLTALPSQVGDTLANHH